MTVAADAVRCMDEDCPIGRPTVLFHSLGYDFYYWLNTGEEHISKSSVIE
jgi:hypothetical protein